MEKIDYEWNSDYAETAMLESKIIVKVEGLVSYSNPSMLTSDDLLFSDGNWYSKVYGWDEKDI
jgi:hypothetical protein